MSARAKRHLWMREDRFPHRLFYGEQLSFSTWAMRWGCSEHKAVGHLKEPWSREAGILVLNRKEARSCLEP